MAEYGRAPVYPTTGQAGQVVRWEALTNPAALARALAGSGRTASYAVPEPDPPAPRPDPRERA